MPGLYGPPAVGESITSRAGAAVRLSVKDAIDIVRRRRAPFSPPRRMWPPGVANFGLDGREQVNLMIGLGKLSPEARMIEVQCGSGLRARSLTDWLGPGALYDGLDTDPALPVWCDRAYERRLDFEFHHHAGLDAPLPFDDDSKDFVLMWDVLPGVGHAVVVHLLAEAHRILLPDGCLFISAYLLDGEATTALAEGRARIEFADRDVSGSVAPDGTRAQDEEWLLDRVAEAGFKNVGIRHGTWAGRSDGRSPFDILVARM